MLSNFIQKVKEKVRLDTSTEVYHYNEPLYPEITDYLIENSITAKTSAVMLSNYIVGRGFGVDINTISISNELNLLDFTRKLTDSVSKNRGAFILLKFDLLTEKYVGFDVLPFYEARIGKKDDVNWNGKIALSKDWTKKTNTKIDVYNPIAVSEQIRKNGKNYKGQIYFLNLDYNRYYPNSIIHPVINDCKSEINASIFKSTILESGFFGKTLVITQPFTNNSQNGEELHKAQSERDVFRAELQKFKGVENSNGFLHLEMDFNDVADIDKKILFKDIKINFDDKAVEYTERSVRENIMRSFYNIPPDLVLQSNNIVGNSGEALRQYQLLYQKNTAHVRSIVENTINELWVNHENYNGEKLKIIPLIEE